MDLILGSFANAHIPGFAPEELDQYDDLLQNSDPDLYNWLTGREPVPANLLTPVMEKVLAHHYAAHPVTGSDDTNR